MSEATEVSILSTTMMKPTKKSDDDSLLQYPNKIMKTPALKKRKYYINPGSVRHHSNWGSLTHQWQHRKKTNCLLHFRVLNLKNFSLNHAMSHPAMMGSQEQTMINSR